jgi:ATP-binding protein involved in chromosome partitioning
MAIKKIIAIASAKGGVGKSSVTAALAIEKAKNYKVGVLDADIYGPNQHLLFKIENKKPEIITIDDKKYFKPITVHNVKLNSMGLILDSDKAALWRGPMLSGAIKQLIHSTQWGDLDYLFIDMPPGTGDPYLTINSEIKPDHSILITTPNTLAEHDLIKSIEVFRKLDTNILGYVENNISNKNISYDFKLLYDLNLKKLVSISFCDDIFEFNPKKTHNSIKDLSSLI